MLKHIHTLLSADLLYTLQSMGHGDTLAIVDANFPAESTSEHRHISMPGVDVTQVLEAVIYHMPLDAFTSHPISIMAQDNSDQPTDSAKDFLHTINQSDESEHTESLVDRMDFYKQARQCQVIISTSDLRPYACLILQKGVVFD